MLFCKSCENGYSDKQHCLQRIRPMQYRKYIWLYLQICMVFWLLPPLLLFTKLKLATLSLLSLLLLLLLFWLLLMLLIRFAPTAMADIRKLIKVIPLRPPPLLHSGGGVSYVSGTNNWLCWMTIHFRIRKLIWSIFFCFQNFAKNVYLSCTILGSILWFRQKRKEVCIEITIYYFSNYNHRKYNPI